MGKWLGETLRSVRSGRFRMHSGNQAAPQRPEQSTLPRHYAPLKLFISSWIFAPWGQLIVWHKCPICVMQRETWKPLYFLPWPERWEPRWAAQVHGADLGRGWTCFCISVSWAKETWDRKQGPSEAWHASDTSTTCWVLYQNYTRVPPSNRNQARVFFELSSSGACWWPALPRTW